MTGLENGVTRKTPFKVRDHHTAISLDEAGLTMWRMRDKHTYTVSWPLLWRWLETANVRI